MDLSASAVKRRLGLNFLAGVGSQVVTVFQQLVSVPILLYAWGTEVYGVWIIQFSLLGYLWLLADLGFTNVAASAIGIRRAEGNPKAALEVFQSVLLIATVMSGVTIAAGLLLGSFLPFEQLLKVPAGLVPEFRMAFLLLVGMLPPSLVGGLFVATFRGEGKMAQGVLYYSVILRLVEFIVQAIIALSGGGMIAVALGMLINRVVLVAAIGLVLKSQVGWINFGFTQASRTTVRSLIKPAIAHMCVPAGLTINVAGINLVVASLAGPAAVSIVSITRTLGNLSFQGLNMLIQAVWPEMSSLITAGKLELGRTTIFTVGRAAFWMSMIASVGLMLIAGPFLNLWTGGRIPLVWGLLLFQLLAIVASSLWRVPSVTMLAVNRNGLVGAFALIAAAVNVGLALVLLPLLGSTGVGVALFVGELFSVAGVLGPSLRLIDTTKRRYLAAVSAPPTIAEIRRLLSAARSIGASLKGTLRPAREK